MNEEKCFKTIAIYGNRLVIFRTHKMGKSNEPMSHSQTNNILMGNNTQKSTKKKTNHFDE